MANEATEARHRAMYTTTEVARWAKSTPQTARRWVDGYTYQTQSGARWSPPVTQRTSAGRLLTFEDLVEVAAVAAVRAVGVSMQRIRDAVTFATRELGIEHPLLSERFYSDGRELFMRDSATTPHFTNMNRFGQVAWSQLELVLRDVDYEDMTAVRWWPVGRDGGLLFDPVVNFGRPIIAEIGVRTETVFDRWLAGLTMEDLASEYRTHRELVERAVWFENRLPTAA